MEYGDSGVTVGDARSAFDGLGRNDNLRYDATVDDFSFAGSYGNGDKKELAARYKLENLEVRVAWWDEASSGDGDRGAAISATWIAENGINLTGEYSGTDASDGEADDPTNIYLKLGYKTGKSSYGIDWSETQDLGPGDGSSVSLAWVYVPMSGIEVYASYRVESVDNVDDDDDIDAVIGGARVKF